MKRTWLSSISMGALYLFAQLPRNYKAPPSLRTRECLFVVEVALQRLMLDFLELWCLNRVSLNE